MNYKYLWHILTALPTYTSDDYVFGIIINTVSKILNFIPVTYYNNSYHIQKTKMTLYLSCYIGYLYDRRYRTLYIKLNSIFTILFLL